MHSFIYTRTYESTNTHTHTNTRNSRFEIVFINMFEAENNGIKAFKHVSCYMKLTIYKT